MLGRTRSRGRRPRSQVPEVRVLEESRVRREDGGDDTAAAVEKATRQDVVARESPQRPGGQVPGDSRATTSWRDRKSTRLNSSHDQISYAVFCLKKQASPH